MARPDLARLLVTGTALAVLGGGTAVAAEPAAAAEDIGEVLVTAQRRAESLMKVPVSMTAIGADAVADLQIARPVDLAGHVPGVQVTNTSGDGFPIFSVRGVSLNDYSPNQSAPIAVYADGVYASGAVYMANQVFDTARVEVLRGPQGTLYGRNATGGAINFITVKPDFSTNGYLTARGGNYGRFELEGAYQAALTDTLAARVAFNYADADGHVRDAIGAQRFGGTQQTGARLTLVFKPNDTLEATLRATTGRYGPAPVALATRPVGEFGYGAGTYQFFPRLPALAEGFDFQQTNGLDNRTTRAADLSALGRSRNDGRTDQYSVEVLAHLTPALDLVSLTSYGRGRFGLTEDADQSELAIFSDGGRNLGHQFAQDLRLQSAGDAAFSYIAGAYFSKDHIDWRYANHYLTDVDVNGDEALDSQDCLDALDQGLFINCVQANSFRQERKSYAVYADGTLALNDTLSLRAGVRYTQDKLRVHDYNAQVLGSDLVPLFNTIPGSLEDVNAVAPSMSKSWSNVTGRLGLDVRLADGLLLYGTLSTGYRGGSFNAQAYNGPDELTSANPEKLAAFEVGVKGYALERRLVFTAAAFAYRYKDQQALNVDASFRQTAVNLAKSELRGAELEVTYQPVDDLRVGFNASILDTQVKRATVSGVDIAGNELVLAPKFSGSANLAWTALQGSTGEARLFLEATYTARQWMDLYNNPTIASGGHLVANGRLTYELANVPLTLALWGRNLFDRYYLTSGVDVSSLGFQYLHIGAPRTFGVEASYRF